MRIKNFLCGTAAFLLAAVLLSTQMDCRAVNCLSTVRTAIWEALEEIGLSPRVAVSASPRTEGVYTDTDVLENSCIIGHSHAVGLQMTLDMDEPDYIAEVGMMTESMLYHGDFALPDGDTGSLRRGLEKKSYENIFILLGTNDMMGGADYLPDFKASMETLLDTVTELQPNAEICLLSIAPLGKSFQEYCYYNYGLTQETVADYNFTLRALAHRREVGFLDITTALSDEDGFLAAEYNRGDGLHFNEEGNLVIMNAILAYLGA